MTLKETLKRYHLHPQKSLGQNFLMDQNILQKIVSASQIKEDETVIEIGTGLGTLTQALAVKAKKVMTFEKDKRLLSVVKEELKEYQNISYEGDFLKANLENLSKTKIIANLPYYISTEIMTRILEKKRPPKLLVLMLQKEVAHRMIATPGSKDYGSLSILVQYKAKAEIITKVSSQSFYPKPKVDSAVIRLTPYQTYPIKVADEKLFFQLVYSAFNQRRKNLKNALTSSPFLNLSQDLVITTLKEVDIDPMIRGEALTLLKFSQLSNALSKKNPAGK